MTYRIGLVGPSSVQFEKLLLSAEMHLNGMGLQAQAPESSGSAVHIPGCPDSTKGGHDVLMKENTDYLPVILIALVVGALAGFAGGFVAGKILIRSTKGGHD